PVDLQRALILRRWRSGVEWGHASHALKLEHRVVEVHRNGAVIGAPHLGVDRRSGEVARRAGARQHEVDAPADVLLANTEALAPPGVLPRLLPADRAKGVDPAADQPARELLPLLGQEAAGLLVLLGPSEVDLARRGVEVAHDDDRLAGALGGVERAKEAPVEAELERDSAVVAVFPAAVGKVAIDDGQRADAGDLNATLDVHRLDAERGPHLVEGMSREEPDAAVAFALGADPVGVPAVGPAKRLR